MYIPDLRSIILKQNTNTLPMMHPPNRLGKHGAHLQNLQLRTTEHMFVLGDRVRRDDFIQTRGVDALDGVAGEDAVRHEREDGVRAFLLEQFGRPRDRVRGIGQVVDEDRGAVLDGADEEHGGVLAVVDGGWTTFLGVRSAVGTVRIIFHIQFGF